MKSAIRETGTEISHLMLPPVRVNTKLAEAPSFKRTIFEHAVDSNGARDYIRVVEWLRAAEDVNTKAA